MVGKQFTFRVGGGAEMYVSSDGARRGQAIGKHVLAPSTGSSSTRQEQERMVSFDRTKAVAVDGGFLTPKEKKKGKKPLPEHLFRQWVRDRQAHPEYAVEIRSALEKRAELEAQALDVRHVPTTREIVRGNRKPKSTDRPSKRRKGGTANDPVVIDSDGSYRDDFSASESDDGPKSKRNRDGKNGNWGHAGEAKRGRGSRDRGNRNGGKFSGRKHEHNALDPRIDGAAAKGRRNGAGAGASGKRKKRGPSNKSPGGAGEKIRGGGSKYRGTYF